MGPYIFSGSIGSFRSCRAEKSSVCCFVRLEVCGRRYIGPKTSVATKGGQVVLLGTLDREATKETPFDGVSVMGNPMLGRRTLVSSRVWQPGSRL